MASPIIPVILAGGYGKRLAPLSTPERPKPFLRLLGEESLLQQTLRRAQAVADGGAVMIACGHAHEQLLAEQLAGIGCNHYRLIVEPVSRNTGPTIAWITAQCQLSAPDAVLLILPADHAIERQVEWVASVKQAASLAEQGYLATFAMMPDSASADYGYLRRGEPVDREDIQAYRVAAFVEKPDEATAASYVASGQYGWNSGMFLGRVVDFAREYACYQPDMWRQCQQMARAQSISNYCRIGDAYADLPDISIDYAVMEHSGRLVMIPCDIGWSDIGTFGRLNAVRAQRGLPPLP